MNMPTEFEMNHMNYDGNRKCTVYIMTMYSSSQLVQAGWTYHGIIVHHL